MKKYMCFFTILVFLLTGCDGQESDNSANSENNTQNPSLYGVNRLNTNNETPDSRDFNNNSENKSDTIDFTNVDSKVDMSENDSSQGNVTNDVANNLLLSTYSTKILTDDNNRYNNIKIVSDRLNNYVLNPGEEFSFNDVCGPYGKDDGFMEATILLSNGKEDKGYGGGVCQLSSTLYNAVDELNLEITEHHHHSSPVAYVPKNQDATVSIQSNLDFKFKNILDYPIKFRTTYDPDNLTVFIDKA